MTPQAVVIVLLDGLGDRPHACFGGRTANDVARTPVLDRLCGRGAVGLHWALGPGRAPSSELAHWALLGYRQEEFCGRAIFEARGRGIAVDPHGVYAFAALRPSVKRDGVRWLRGRAGPDQAGEASELLARLARIDGSVRVVDLGRGEAIVHFADVECAAVTDSETFLEGLHPLLLPQAVEPAAAATAARMIGWTRRAHEVLAEEELDTVTLKWPGTSVPAPPFRERHGVDGPLVGASAFLMGLAATLCLEQVLDADSDDAAGDLARRLEHLAGALDAGSSFAFCHTKAPDEAGHTKDPSRKRATIEALDGVLARLEQPPFDRAVVCITGDHATPASGPAIIHSGDPVPLVVVGRDVLRDDVTTFGESAARRGGLGRLVGRDLMPTLLNAAGRPAFLGTRAVPDRHAQGLAARPVPWRDDEERTRP